MVAPIGESVNISFFNSSSNTIPPRNTILPTVDQVNNTGMDILKGQAPDNYNEVRGRMLSLKSNISRDTSMSSVISAKPYHKRMTQNNDMDINNNNNKDTSPELSYETSQEKVNCLSIVAEKQADILPLKGNLTNDSSSQCIPDNHPISIPTQGSPAQNDESAFINILLPYDPNAPMDSEIWGSNFHPISLHSLIEHIMSDAKNIKDSLKFMAKYITNKQIDPSKANDLNDFKGIREAVWNFISSIYKANWDVLFTDNNSTSLRKKIVAKYTPKIQLASQRNNKEKNSPTLASIKRLPLLILDKSPKKVNAISKFFKSSKMNNSLLSKAKFYAQVFKQNVSTSDIIKIKKTFPSMRVKEIDQINNIVKEFSKPKPCIQITTKVSSSQMVDLVSLYFIFYFHLFSFYFYIFIFLEHRIRVRSQDTENEVKGSRTNDVIQHRYHMLTSCSTHGHLG